MRIGSGVCNVRSAPVHELTAEVEILMGLKGATHLHLDLGLVKVNWTLCKGCRKAGHGSGLQWQRRDSACLTCALDQSCIWMCRASHMPPSPPSPCRNLTSQEDACCRLRLSTATAWRRQRLRIASF